MKKSELLEKIKNAKDDEDINSLLVGTDIEEEFKVEPTLDVFKSKLKDKDFKAFMESENDKHFNKALVTWKENNLEKELEPLIQKKYPDLVTDPTQKKLLELEKELEKERQANARKDLLAEAMKYATEKNIPTNIVEKLLEEDLEKTKSTIDSFSDSYSKGLEKLVDERLQSSSYTPPGGTGDNKVSIGASFAQQQNNNKTAVNDPWSNK